jgi:hypothetical protein
MKKIAIVCIAMMAYAAAQTPPAPAKKFEDDKEQTEAIGANTEKDPKAQLQKLDLWKHDYPETEYAVDRLGLYFVAYGALKDYHNQVAIAQELRKTLPDNLQLLRTIFGDVPQIKPPSAEDLAAMTDAANYILNNADKVFDPKSPNKGAGQSDADWAALKPQMIEYSKNQLDWVAEQQGMDAVTNRLKADPSRVALNVWLGQQILADVKAHPDHAVKQGDAIFNYARAASYTGPGCLDPKARAQTRSFVDRAYKTFHGSMEGEDKLLAVAAAQPLPDGYKIPSLVDVAEGASKADAEWRQAHPMLAAWRDTKAIVTADDGQAKFDSDIKDSALPSFSGKIVSMTPAVRPKTIVLSVDPEKDGASDCTLIFAAPLAGKMEPGETLTFEGIAKSFVKDPYMLTVTVEKDKLEGWTGKNAPSRPASTKSTTKKGN